MKKALTLLLACLCSISAIADERPFQLSITPDLALHPTDTLIKGISLNIWGENQQRSINFGFINGSNGDSSGISVGLVTYNQTYTGVNFATVNYTANDFKGLQAGFVNFSGGETNGIQLGVANIAMNLSGLQIGILNYARTVEKGVQIGLVNIIHNNLEYFHNLPDQVAPIMTLINWRF